MTNKPKNSQTRIPRIAFVLAAFLLVIVNPIAADAKMFELASSPLDSTSNSFVFTNSSIHSSIMAPDNADNTPAPAIDTDEDKDQAQRLDAYFDKYDMPLSGYGIEFVRAAKKYNVDWRLIAAIGVRESSGGKHMMNNNPFGWGSAKIKFDDFSEAIDVVTSNLGGFNPTTSKWYKDTDTKEKLWHYNGSVMASYPDEVMNIMNMF